MKHPKTMIFFVCSLFLSSTASSSALDASSPYLPALESVNWSGLSYVKSEQPLQGQIQSQVDVSFRVHRNSVSFIGLSFQNAVLYRPSSLELNCDNYFSLTAGDVSGKINSPALNLVSRIQDGDWYIERYVIKVSGFIYNPLCPGNYSEVRMRIFDQAGRDLTLGFGSKGKFQASTFWSKLGASSSYLPCPVAISALSSGDGLELQLCNSKDSGRGLKLEITKDANSNNSLPEVIDYLKLTETLRSQLTTVATEKNALQSQLTTVTTEKNALQSQLTTVTTEKNALQSQVANLESRNSALESQNNVNSLELGASQKRISNLAAKIKKICAAKIKPKGC